MYGINQKYIYIYMKINRMKSENIIFEKFDVSSLQLARKKWQIFDIVIET